MRKVTWIRLSLASAVLLVGVGGVLVGCSDDDTTNPVTPKKDAGNTSDVVTPTDDSSTPTTDAGDSSTAKPYPKITIIHAAPGIAPAVRFCMSVNGAFPLDAVLPTVADAPKGVLFGTGGALKVDATRAAVLPTLDITPIAVPADVDPAKKCSDLITTKDGVQTLPAGAVKLTTITKGTLVGGKSYFVSILGCPAGADAGALGSCGQDDAGTANVRLEVAEVDTTTTVPAGSIGAQFLHDSPALNVAAAGGVEPAFTYQTPGVAPDAGTTTDAGDAGTDDAAAADAATGDAAVPPEVHIVGLGATGVKYLSKPVTVPASTFKDTAAVWTNQASAAFNLYATLGTNRGPGIFTGKGLPNGLPLALITQATTGQTATSIFVDGKAYTFIAIGDPSIAAAPGNTGFRIIALPNDPNTIP